VPVLETSGEMVSGVRALDVLLENQRLTRKALAGIDDQVVTVGDDCSVDIASISAVHARYGDALTVLWIDAHPDVYSPQTLRSGAFHAMVVRALLGEGPAGLTPERPLTPQQVIIAGERANVASEREYLARTGLRRHGVEDLEQVLESARGPVYGAHRPRRPGANGLRLNLLPGAERCATAAIDRPRYPGGRHCRCGHHRARPVRRRHRRQRGRGHPGAGRRTGALTLQDAQPRSFAPSGHRQA
jgi:hypothetical protein